MRKLALIILDGWGIGEEKPNNGIFMAKTPFFDYLWKNFPHTQLQASGAYVGLPDGQIGGSEVGHMTIGAGRGIFQDLLRINRSLKNHNDKNEGISNNLVFQQLTKDAQQTPLHMIGMISTSGIHSH